MFTSKPSPILGLTIYRPYIFKDFRGEYTETFNADEIRHHPGFVQDSAILSTKGVLRGYHGDDRTWKLITCLQGAFQITVACIDPDDTMFKKTETMILDDKERLMVLLPPKFVNAHQCLTDTCLFFYKQDTFYKGQKYQYSIYWREFDEVKWPIPPILSQRDETARSLFRYVEEVDITGVVRGIKLLSPEEVNE